MRGLETFSATKFLLGGKMSIQTDHEIMELDQDAANWVQLYRETLASIKLLQEQADIARANIESQMGTCTVGLYNNRPLVRWTNVTSSRLDVNKVKEALSPELIAQFSSTTSSRRFTIVNED